MSIVNIARCPEHGLHGERTECFVCRGPVEKVPMLAWDHAHAAMLRFRERIMRAAEPAALVLDEDAFMDAWSDALAATTPDLGDLGAVPDAPPLS